MIDKMDFSLLSNGQNLSLMFNYIGPITMVKCVHFWSYVINPINPVLLSRVLIKQFGP